MALYLGDTKISSVVTAKQVTQTVDVVEQILIKDVKTNKIYSIYFENGELQYSEQS